MNTTLGSIFVALALVIGSVAAATAQPALYSITADPPAPEQLHPLTLLKRINPATGETISAVPVTMVNPPPPISAGDTRNEFVMTGNGLGAHPQSGQLYAVLSVQSDVETNVNKRHLAVIDPVTGLATLLRDVGQFAAIAFTTGGALGVGALLGVTDDFTFGNFCPPAPGCVGAALYQLNDSGTVTKLKEFNSLTSGEAIAFSPTDLRLYHTSGGGNGRIFESVDLSNPGGTPTNIPLSGAASQELTALTWFQTQFLAADANKAFFTVNPSLRAISKIGDLDHLSGGLALVSPPPRTTLVASVLPGSRSVQIPTPATAFATVVNSGPNPAFSVGLGLPTTIPSLPATIQFNVTDCHTNIVFGADNVPTNINPGAQACYVFALTPSDEFGPVEVALTYAGVNTDPVATLPAINTLLASASLAAVPDMIAIAVTPTADGILRVQGVGATAAFATATANVGSTGAIIATANTGGTTLPLEITLCQTNPVTGVCISPIGSSVSTVVNAADTPTFAIFVKATGPVALDPAVNRIFLILADQGAITRGRASVAVTTQ